MISAGTVIFGVILLGFIGLCLYSMLMPRYYMKKGRVVDARVVSCIEQMVKIGDEEAAYYAVTIDFYGLNGETIVKEIKSEKPYEEGDVIRMRYLDKLDRYMLDADNIVKQGNVKGPLLIIAVCVLILAMIVFFDLVSDAEGNFPDWVLQGTGYVISLIFMGIGVLGIKQKLQLGREKEEWEKVEGILVDYTRKKDEDGAASCFPIYEYTWRGETARHKSKVGGSGKKYRKIGRRVQMLCNPRTKVVKCREEEEDSSRVFLIFGTIGLFVFCILLACSLGFLPT
ncbi:MAG: hypothetical protein J1E65_05675 [Lachnospiraceae bacterium]|nr:hypothetical protein [Lachnospiraceae bacterium]